MRVDRGRYSFQLNPAKSVLFFQLFVVISSFLLISLLPVLVIYKIFPLFIVALIGVRVLESYFAELPIALDYRSVTNKWLLDGKKVRLHSEQFITRNLIILFLVTEDGRKLAQTVPADAMSADQHRCLRSLLIACMQASPCEQSHPDRQN